MSANLPGSDVMDSVGDADASQSRAESPQNAILSTYSNVLGSQQRDNSSGTRLGFPVDGKA